MASCRRGCSCDETLSAALLLGVFHAIWRLHLPLFGVEYSAWNGVPWAFSVYCFSIVIAWVFQQTCGSVLIPMLMHASNDIVAVVWRMFVDAPVWPSEKRGSGK